MYAFASRLASPFTLALVALLALVVIRRRPAPRGALALVLVLIVVSHPFAAWLLVGSLEWRYQPNAPPPRDVGAIVILSGYTLVPDVSTRVLAGLRLYRALDGRVPVLVTGGFTRDRPLGPSEAREMRDLLVDAGVPPADVLMEERARTTHENALYSAQLLEPRGVRRVALVTEAVHLPRAEPAFRAAGLDAVPVPCGFKASAAPRLPLSLLPSASAAFAVQRATHEWVGIAWYALRGYSR